MKKIFLLNVFLIYGFAMCNCSPNVAYDYSVATKTILKAYYPMFDSIDKLKKSLQKYYAKEKKRQKH